MVVLIVPLFTLSSNTFIADEVIADSTDNYQFLVTYPHHCFSFIKATRRFNASDVVQAMVDFAHVQGYPPATHDLVIPRPRQVLSEQYYGKTLKDLGLGKRELIELELRDLG